MASRRSFDDQGIQRYFRAWRVIRTHELFVWRHYSTSPDKCDDKRDLRRISSALLSEL